MRTIGTERGVGDGGEERRVGAAAEGDDDASEPDELVAERGELGVDHASECVTRSHRATNATAASSTTTGSAGARIRWAP